MTNPATKSPDLDQIARERGYCNEREMEEARLAAEALLRAAKARSDSDTEWESADPTER